MKLKELNPTPFFVWADIMIGLAAVATIVSMANKGDIIGTAIFSGVGMLSLHDLGKDMKKKQS